MALRSFFSFFHIFRTLEYDILNEWVAEGVASEVHDFSEKTNETVH